MAVLVIVRTSLARTRGRSCVGDDKDEDHVRTKCADRDVFRCVFSVVFPSINCMFCVLCV